MRLKLPVNGFIVGLFLSVIAAYLFPDLGAKGGFFKSEITTKLGVITIFFLQGLQLPSENMLYDLMEWKLHLFIQCFNFIIIPAIVMILNSLGGTHLPKDLQIGFLYLAILPTTISTAVVFSGLVGGNQVGAIFNAALSNILAVFIVPVWTAWHLSTTAGLTIPLLPLLVKLALLLILPFIIGQILRPWLKKSAVNFKNAIRRISIGIILFILYSAFCNSFKRGAWQEFGLNKILITFFISFFLLGLIMTIVWVSLKMAKFQYPSKMTAFFCASQKSLATGVPMASSIFAAAGHTTILPVLGVVLLPLMFFHPLQLLIGGLIVGHFSKKI
jgi:sodium/bile acid cotransporter 7